MPTYVYACGCGTRTEAVRRIDDRDDCPPCRTCGGATERRITATMVAVFQPYVTPCFDKESGERMRINSASEHRAFLARNGLEEVGNDKSMAPRPPEEIAQRRREKLKELAADGIKSPSFEFDPDTHEASLTTAAHVEATP